MGDITEELTRIFERKAAGRKHCPTCICGEEVEYTRKVTVSVPKLVSTNSVPPPCCHCKNLGLSYPAWGGQDEPSTRIQQRSQYKTVSIAPSSPGSYVEKLYYWDQKYSMLENWFKRFSCENDGYLSLSELKCLLERLGAPLRHICVQRIFERADRDGDGRLSFSEFLLMWRQAAFLEDEYTGCNELSAIIREHQLYPDVLTFTCPRCPQYNNRTLVKENREVRMTRRPGEACSCCRNSPLVKSTITRIQLSRPDEEVFEAEGNISIKSPPREGGEKPVFSCNRFSIY